MARADRFTTRSNQPIVYRDFVVPFIRDPTTDSILTVVNERAVQQEIANIVLTIRGERFYNSAFGSRTNAMLFEPMNENTATLLRDEIKQSLNNYSTRANNPIVTVTPNEDANGYIVNVQFTIINIQQQFSVDIFLQRVR